MEIEAKYLLKDREQADAILSDSMVKDITDKGSAETIDMTAVYYDTADHALTKSGYAVRVRREGEYYVATMKDRGESSDGMHRRKEINVRLDDEDVIKHPGIEIFKEAGEYEELLKAAGEGELLPVLEMRFERRQVRIDTGKSINVLSCDDGKMIAGDKRERIMEMEVELYSGDEEDMKRFSSELAEKYRLFPEDRSKFARAYALLEK